MPKAIGKQVGGSHYQGGIQPFELSMANRHDACTHAIQKYLTRFQKKAGIVDLQKAHHIVGIRLETLPIVGQRIMLGEYLTSNKIDGHAAACMLAMENWSRTTDSAHDHERAAQYVRKLIRNCAAHHYPEIFNEEEFL